MNPRLIKAYAAKLERETGERRVPLWKAEEAIMGVVQRVARCVSHSFIYGYHSREDVEQDAVVFALEVLETDVYDVSRPLENFLHIHVRNQLSNELRKHYMRLEPPCTCCDSYNPPPFPCKKWLDWKARNESKQNLMRPLDMSNVSDEHESRMRTASSVVDDAVSNEVLNKIDRALPVELRSDYLRMRDHVVIPKARRQRVREAVLAILQEEGQPDAD
jgi:hypothetical protein